MVGFGGDPAVLLTNFVRKADGTFTTLNIANDPFANANGINSQNQIVGLSNNNAFLLSNSGGTLSFLPPVEPGNTGMESAFGINDKGTIVGQVTINSTDTQSGFVYSGGTFTMVNPVSNALITSAQGINNNGLVIGFFSTDGVSDHGFLYNTNSQSYTLLPDPNVANLFLTQFLGINDKNEAVGYYQTNDGSQHGFLYDINTSTYTFLDDPNAGQFGTSITQITGINDSGEITGFYVDAASGYQRGFVAFNSVPEPSTLTLMGIGLIALFDFSLRRRSSRSPRLDRRRSHSCR